MQKYILELKHIVKRLHVSINAGKALATTPCNVLTAGKGLIVYLPYDQRQHSETTVHCENQHGKDREREKEREQRHAESRHQRRINLLQAMQREFVAYGQRLFRHRALVL